MRALDDHALLGELRGVLTELEPIPASASVAARAALRWRTAGVETATPVAGPLLRDALAGRTSTFRAAGMTIELTARSAGDGTLRLTGRIDPPRSAEVVIRHRGGLRATRTDAGGRFAIAGAHAGTLSVRCRVEEPGRDDRLVETASVSI